MWHPSLPVPVPPSVERPTTRRRRHVLVAAGTATAVVLAVGLLLSINGAFASAIGPSLSLGPQAPTSADGLIAEGAGVTLADDAVPAIARLDPALRDALRRAEVDASADGIAFEVTSGWRDATYQRWLLEDAIHRYGSEEVARRFVATPDRSSHVTGHAVDIGPLDAQLWLIEHGSAYGICQTYANERWHFERVTEPGGVCPQMRTDAAS